jgi:hypothetical protein
MTNQKIIPFIKPPKKIKTCSFCERPEKDVDMMFGDDNYGKYICNHCVAHAKKRLDEEIK